MRRAMARSAQLYIAHGLPGVRAHLGTGVSYANLCGDAVPAAWAYRAQSMVARPTGNLSTALAHAERGAAAAPAGLVRG
jgi:hypothetical protein